MNKNLKVKLGGLSLKNPVMTASGTYGYGTEYAEYYDPSLLGAIVVKGITLEPRKGNGPGRLAETPAGLLNCIGLENPGIETFINEHLPIARKINTPIIVNINGNTIEEYVEVAKRLNHEAGVTALELNISCPNVKAGGMAFGSNPEMASLVTKKVKEATKLPLIVKLSPNVTDIVEIAQRVEAEGADMLSMINTLLGMSIDIRKRKPVLSNIFGGLSGPAVKPVALRMIWQTSQKVSIPIIGMGGIVSWEDALEFMMAGATAVAVGTGNFVNPKACQEIIEGLEKYCLENDIENIDEIVGAAWKGE